jgi:hypothetical protein
MDSNKSRMNLVHSPKIYFLKVDVNIILPFTPMSHKWYFPFRFSRLKFCVHISSLPRVLHATHLVLCNLITLIVTYSMESRAKNYEAPQRYAEVPIFLLLLLCWIQIFSSVSCSQTLTMYVLPLGREINSSCCYLDGKRTYYELHASNHSQNRICFLFLRECNFDLYCRSKIL